MPLSYWVQLQLGNKNYKQKVYTEGCAEVDDENYYAQMKIITPTRRFSLQLPNEKRGET